jgi:hypothetical protein
MAPLYGRLQGSRQEVTRTGHYDIWSRLERWEGSIDVTLDCNGDFEVRMGEKNYPRTLIAAGNVNTRQLVEPANVS